MSDAQKIAKYGPVMVTYRSRSDPDKTYDVRQKPGLPPSCNCKGWIFNHNCIHVRAFAMNAGATIVQIKKKGVVSDVLTATATKAQPFKAPMILPLAPTPAPIDPVHALAIRLAADVGRLRTLTASVRVASIEADLRKHLSTVATIPPVAVAVVPSADGITRMITLED